MSTIRAKAVCLFRRDGQILLSEGYDPAKEEKYLIPVGGGIEFGEKAEEAAIRETFEEIGAKIYDLSLLGVTENIFTFDNQKGHEIVFVYEAKLEDEGLYHKPEMVGIETNGESFVVKWFSEDEIITNKVPFYPNGIAGLLSNG